MSSFDDAVRARFAESRAASEKFLEEETANLARAVDLAATALTGGHKLLFFGNGGSAADAQHLAAEMVGRLCDDRRPLPAIALTTDTSALTAIANDYGYDHVFARQVTALGNAGDVAIAISTSGKSPSILHAVTACRERGVGTIGFTGGTGGELAGAVDVSLCVSAVSRSSLVQETHILIGHILCEQVEQRVLGAGS